MSKTLRRSAASASVKQVEEQRGEAAGAQGIGDMGVARAQPAAAAAVGEDDDAARRLGDDEFPFKPPRADAGPVSLHGHDRP
jgi:hypothetical protein